MPSVMAMMTLMPASAASMMASAAPGGGTKTTLALAPVLRTASATVLNSGKPSLVRAPLAGRNGPDDLRAVFAALQGVEGARLAEPLDDHPGVLVDEDAHEVTLFLPQIVLMSSAPHISISALYGLSVRPSRGASGNGEPSPVRDFPPPLPRPVLRGGGEGWGEGADGQTIIALTIADAVKLRTRPCFAWPSCPPHPGPLPPEYRGERGEMRGDLNEKISHSVAVRGRSARERRNRPLTGLGSPT